MTTEGKLVRDWIPDIIRANGEEPITYQADPTEYRQRLRDKLLEEVNEFLTAAPGNAVEELADVLEVVYALAADLGTDRPTLEQIRQTKAAERGAFASRLVWLGVR
jgi:predicted house-cleaning noncanonical NTP pyrophosphatase (MazG superfamily)